MRYELAPMEGITGYIVRNAYHHYFDDIDRYYTPFIPAGKKMNRKVIRDLLPENNQGIRVVPQLMANHAQDVLDACDTLKSYGYGIVNINLGCPSGTVAHKGRGAGFLDFPEELDHFLEEIFAKTDFKISLKTRVGVKDTDAWEQLLEIYGKYPLESLIVHPRIQKDFYKNHPRMEMFDLAVEKINVSLCYNGDLVSVTGMKTLEEKYPTVETQMIGRGLLAKPGLLAQVKADCSVIEDENGYKKQLRAFHDEIIGGYLSIFSGEKDAMFHMKEMWLYLYRSFADSEKYLKAIKKAQTMRDYEIAVDGMFRDCAITHF